MTQLCELRDVEVNANYFNSFFNKEKFVPIIYAHSLYKFLHKFYSKSSTVIFSIKIIKPKDERIEKFLLNSFKNYSPEIADYEEDILEIENSFPDEELLTDRNLKIKFSNMIQNIRPIEIENLNRKEEYTCYLPLISSQINKIINEDEHCITIFTDPTIAKYDSDELLEIDTMTYRKVYRNLINVKDNYNKLFKDNKTAAEQFVPPKYLDNFKGEYFEKLKRIKSNKKMKELYFYGAETHTAKEGLHFIFGNYNFNEHDLQQDHQIIDSNDRPYVFWNFGKFFNSNRQNYLSQQIRENIPKHSKNIQGDNSRLTGYFQEYKKIALPNEEEIKTKINGIFISFIFSEGIFNGKANNLFLFIKYNLLGNLLENIDNPKILFNVIKDFGNISTLDLMENTSFWCTLIREYEEKLVELKKQKYDDPLYKWIFDVRRNDNIYYVKALDVKQGPYDYDRYFIHILMIVQYSKIYKKPITAEILRKAVLKYHDESIPEEVNEVVADNTISKSFNRAINDKNIKWLDRFLKYIDKDISKKHIKYYFDPELYDTQIIGANIEHNFFDNL